MALSLRLRRAITLSSFIIKDNFNLSSSHLSKPQSSPRLVGTAVIRNPRIPQSQYFSTYNRRFDGEETKIGPDDILFEGCDYNHWLITIDFPKDPRPTDAQMVETYVQTAAKVFGSVEEAKKRIYACSTSTYNGFQVLCDEATSEKFRGLPGVVFILPDSYIDPVNKQYGGDKYDNGVITPRPPPIQYGRQGRYGDRNRNFDQPRYNSPQDGRGHGPPPPRDGRGYGLPPQDGRGFGQPPQDGRGYGPPPQDGRGFGPPPQDGRGYGLPPQDGRGFGPPPQDGRGYGPPPQGGRGYGAPQQDVRGYGPPPQDRRGFGPPSQEGCGYGQGQGERRNYVQGGARDGYQGGQGDQMPPYGFSQGQPGNLPPQEQRSYSAGPGGGCRPGSAEYGHPSPGYSGDYRQGSGPGYDVDNRQVEASGYGGDYNQGPDLGNRPSSAVPVEGQWQGNN